MPDHLIRLQISEYSVRSWCGMVAGPDRLDFVPEPTPHNTCARCLANYNNSLHTHPKPGAEPYLPSEYAVQKPSQQPLNVLLMISDESYARLSPKNPHMRSKTIVGLSVNPHQYKLNLPEYDQDAPLIARLRASFWERTPRKPRWLILDEVTEASLASIVERLHIPSRGKTTRAQAGLALELILRGWLVRDGTTQ